MPDLSDVFAALGDPTRREVLQRLVDGGPATATELARDLPVTRQAVSKHLGVLVEAGVLTRERTGREVRYHLDAEALEEAADWLATTGAAWDRRLGALERAARRWTPGFTAAWEPPVGERTHDVAARHDDG